MSLTYPTDTTQPLIDPVVAPRADLAHDEPFVPVYARRGKARGGQNKIKAWMILTPVAVLTLGGIGAMMIMNGDEEAAAPLAEPAETLPVLPTTPATVESAAPLTSAADPAPVIATPPAVREAAPLRRVTPAPTPARRTAAATPAQAPAARVQAPAPVAATGPQPYAPAPAGPSTSTVNTAPATPTPAPAPTPPVIVVEPVD